MFSCPNSSAGCQASLRLSDCEAHLSVCKFQPKYPINQSESVTCTTCGELVEDVAMSRHLSLICPNKMVACSFTSIGCKQKLPRRLLQVIYSTFQYHTGRASHSSPCRVTSPTKQRSTCNSLQKSWQRCNKCSRSVSQDDTSIKIKFYSYII